VPDSTSPIAVSYEAHLLQAFELEPIIYIDLDFQSLHKNEDPSNVNGDVEPERPTIKHHKTSRQDSSVRYPDYLWRDSSGDWCELMKGLESSDHHSSYQRSLVLDPGSGVMQVNSGSCIRD